MSSNPEQMTQRIEAEIESCVKYITDKSLHHTNPEFPTIASYINDYRDERGYTLLHLAVESGNINVITKILEAKPELCHQTAEGTFAFGLKNANQLHVGLFKDLLFNDVEWRSDPSYIQQLSQQCEYAVKHKQKELLKTCLPMLLKTTGPHFTLTTLVSHAHESPLVWLCQTPGTVEMLDCYFDCMHDQNALYGPKGFWTTLTSQLHNCQDDTEGSEIYQAFRKQTGATSVTLLEIALLHNPAAAEFLIKKDKQAHIVTQRAEHLQKNHQTHFASHPKRSTAVYDFLIAYDTPNILTHNDCLAFAFMVPAMLPPPFEKLYKADLIYPYRPADKNPCAELKRLMQRVVISYFARTLSAKENHGSSGAKCAATLFTHILQANTCEQIWAAVGNLLLNEPKKTLQENSLRAIILRMVTSDSNPARQACFLTPNHFQLPDDSQSWNKTLQITVGLLICTGTHQPSGELLHHNLMNAVNIGTRIYVQQYPKLTEDGVSHAATRWQTLARSTRPKPFLEELITCLKNRPGTTHSETSHRTHLIRAIIADETICKALQFYPNAEHPSMQEDVVNALSDYCKREYSHAAHLTKFGALSNHRGDSGSNSNNTSSKHSAL